MNIGPNEFKLPRCKKISKVLIYRGIWYDMKLKNYVNTYNIIFNVWIINSNQFNSQDSPPAENDEDVNEGESSEAGLEEGMPAEIVNQQCCAGSKACLIL